jgi:hypothetical protein
MVPVLDIVKFLVAVVLRVTFPNAKFPLTEIDRAPIPLRGSTATPLLASEFTVIFPE